MRQRESVPMTRGWTGGAAWKGAGASLLLHLSVGAAMIVALSGPPKAPSQVIDLTLLPPAEIDQRPVPPAFAAPEPPGTAVLPEPPPAVPEPLTARRKETTVVAATPAPPDRPAVTATSRPSEVAGGAPRAVASPGSGEVTNVFTRTDPVVAGSPQGAYPGASAAPAATGADAGGEPGESHARARGRYLEGNFAWIRDTIQRAIAYPAAARRMGWEGKVVVAFQLLSDGSVRDVRVVQGSGHAALDRGAIDAVRNASPFPRSPVEAEVITPVVYRLTTR